MLLTPTIFAIFFMAFLIILPFILKIMLKIKSCFGYCRGVCCSLLTSLIIGIYISLVQLSILAKILDKSNKEEPSSETTDDIAMYFIGYAIGILLLIVLFIGILMAILFLLIFCFTKRISTPEIETKTAFMFFSGYILPKGLFFYLIIIASVQSMNYAIEQLIEKGTPEAEAFERISPFTSGLIVYAEFWFLIYLFSYIGCIIMCMLHHRKVNSFIIWINVACFFSPLFFLLLFFMTLKFFFLQYGVLLPMLCSFGFGIFFYCKYGFNSTQEIVLPNEGEPLA